VLTQLRAGKGGTIEHFDHNLFRRGGQPTFLALIWARRRYWVDEQFERTLRPSPYPVAPQ
jgi:hypothetical protein